MNDKRRLKTLSPAWIALILLFFSLQLQSQKSIWVGTWSCAPYAAGEGNTPPAPYLADNTLRQVIRVSGCRAGPPNNSANRSLVIVGCSRNAK